MMEVVAARVERDGRYLICRRPAGKRNGGLWEFPGGKVERGETDAQALARELMEELDIDVTVGQKLAEVEHDYGDFTIRLRLYEAGIRAGELRLKEHSDARFVLPEELNGFELCPADAELIEKC